MIKEPNRPLIKIPAMEQCIIHKDSIKIDAGDNLINPQTYESWQVMLEAAKVRNFAPILQLSETLAEKEIPQISYHKKCRSIFTMKNVLATLKRKANILTLDEDEGSEPSTKKKNRSGITQKTVYEKVCIFCEKVKRLKGSATREKLTQATQLRVDDTLRKCSEKHQDAKIMEITSRDIVAAEAHYHKSCYRNYTRATNVCEETKE